MTTASRLGPANRTIRHRDLYYRLEWDAGRAVRDTPAASVTLKRDGPYLYLNHINRRALPPGSGAEMLAQGMAPGIESGRPPVVLIVEEIINDATLAAYRAREKPSASVLGRMVERSVAMHGGRVRMMRWVQDRKGHLTIEVDLDWERRAGH